MPSSVAMTSPPGRPRTGLLRQLFCTLELIKFSHSVFALPFALSAMLVAAQGVPSLRTLLWILWCLVAARTAAMAFNRWADWDYDAFNPRTKRRSQLGTKRTTMALCLVALIAFVFGSSQLNLLTLALCPVACVIILGYSLTKRFTAYSHAFLGLALAAAPMGAWAATTGNLTSPLPWLLAAGVWCWVFGFDLIYATQDVEFDRQAQLHSYPARHGVAAALRLARMLHFFTWLILIAFGWLAHLGMPYYLAMALVFFALIFEHIYSRSSDLAKINIAFFQMNALVGLFLVVGISLCLASDWVRAMDDYFIWHTSNQLPWDSRRSEMNFSKQSVILSLSKNQPSPLVHFLKSDISWTSTSVNRLVLGELILRQAQDDKIFELNLSS